MNEVPFRLNRENVGSHSICSALRVTLFCTLHLKKKIDTRATRKLLICNSTPFTVCINEDHHQNYAITIMLCSPRVTSSPNMSVSFTLACTRCRTRPGRYHRQVALHCQALRVHSVQKTLSKLCEEESSI